MPKTRKDTDIWLIPPTISAINGSKFPTNNQVIGRLFYLIRELKLSVTDSANVVAVEVMAKWDNIPTQNKNRVSEKLVKLYLKWKSLNKHKDRTSETNVKARTSFTSVYEHCFDISHRDAAIMMKNEEDILFHKNLKKNKVSGCIGPLDKKLSDKQARSNKRAETAQKRRIKHQQQQQKTAHQSTKVDDASSDSQNDTSDSDEFLPPTPVKKRERQFSLLHFVLH